MALFIGSFFTFSSRMSQLWSYHCTVTAAGCYYFLTAQGVVLLLPRLGVQVHLRFFFGLVWRLVSMETARTRKRKKFSRVDAYVNRNWPCRVHFNVTDALSSCTGRPVFKSKGKNVYTKSIVVQHNTRHTECARKNVKYFRLKYLVNLIKWRNKTNYVSQKAVYRLPSDHKQCVYLAPGVLLLKVHRDNYV